MGFNEDSFVQKAPRGTIVYLVQNMFIKENEGGILTF